MFNTQAEAGVHFFKHITPTACTDRLEIPLSHCWNTNGVFPDSVILKDMKGNAWPVKLQIVENRVCFVDAGWLKFVKDNRIQPEYLLVVFLNDGGDDEDGPYNLNNNNNNNNNVFSFLLFDSVTECASGGFLGPSNDDDDDDDDDDVLLLPSSSSSFFLQHSSTMGKEKEIWISSDESMEDFDFDDDDDDDECPADPRRGNTSSARAKKNRRRTTDKGTQKIDIYGNDIFRSGVIPWPKNPYFMFYLNKSRPNELCVPCMFAKDYRLHLPKNAMIRDSQGLQWETELHQWNDGRVLYIGGWGCFARVNHVQDDEPCVCEFVYQDGGACLKKKKYGGASLKKKRYGDFAGKSLTLYAYKVAGRFDLRN